MVAVVSTKQARSPLGLASNLESFYTHCIPCTKQGPILLTPPKQKQGRGPNQRPTLGFCHSYLLTQQGELRSDLREGHPQKEPPTYGNRHMDPLGKNSTDPDPA